MELAETVETINRQLREHYSFDANSGQPIFRVIWSDDQIERVLTDTTPEGLQLLNPRVIERPKYSYAKGRFILERLVVVPEVNKSELLEANLSYEPIWIFETQLGVYLPPKWEAAKIIVDSLYAALGKKSMRKYVDEEAKNPVEHRNARLKKIHEELFGNETATGDALAHGFGTSLSGPRLTTAESTSPKE